MSLQRSPTLRSLLGWIIPLLVVVLLPAQPSLANERPTALRSLASLSIALLDGATAGPNGLTLAAAAGPAPALAGAYARYGIAQSGPITFAAPLTTLHLDYSAMVPPGTSARIDLRGSIDGRRWLPWIVGLRPGAIVAFERPIVRAEYRVTLLGGLGTSPAVRDISLSAGDGPPTVNAAVPGSLAVAPTFRVRATRQGMVGGRTANGFIIPPRARFVSLPSWSVLSTRGRDEYQVRLTYRGRSTVVPVYDVGPYSGRDDYWNAQRGGFPQLERGWPMDHAAYYEGFNGGQADKGFVRFPTAIDVGDGAWLDDLGIHGDQAELEVTYLWMGQDPAAGPPARDSAAPEQLVDELGGDFWHSAHLSSSTVGCGYGRHAYWTESSTNPDAGPVARWQPNLPAEAMYDLYVHVPVCPSRRAPVGQARYVIQHRDGALEIAVNQAAQTGWVHLGRYPFRVGSEGFVQLGALAGESGGSVWFDQAKWVRVP